MKSLGKPFELFDLTTRRQSCLDNEHPRMIPLEMQQLKTTSKIVVIWEGCVFILITAIKTGVR
jgi:hypothetical protein